MFRMSSRLGVLGLLLAAAVLFFGARPSRFLNAADKPTTSAPKAAPAAKAAKDAKDADKKAADKKAKDAKDAAKKKTAARKETKDEPKDEKTKKEEVTIEPVITGNSTPLLPLPDPRFAAQPGPLAANGNERPAANPNGFGGIVDRGTTPAARGAFRNGQVAPAPDAKLVKDVIALQDKHNDNLLAKKGVVGTATAMDADGNVVIRVYTDGAENPALPDKLDGVPVQVMVTGLFHPFQNVPSPDRLGRQPRPSPIGVSAFVNFGPCASGTLGARVRDSKGNLYAISNNHVFAAENLAPIGSAIVQPSPGDALCVQDPSSIIGRLAAFVPIDFTLTATNRVDAAIIRTDDLNVNTATLGDGYGTPRTDTVLPFLGQIVKKYGRTTGFRRAVVNAVNVTTLTGYSTGVARHIGQFQAIGLDNGATPLGGPGDSGSLVVDDQDHPVGLLFGGGGFPIVHATMNPIDDVLRLLAQELKVDALSIDGGASVTPGKIGKATPNSPIDK